MTTYVVFTRESTIDPQEMKTYADIAGRAGQGHPITRHAFYGDIQVLEGDALEGAVILSFPGKEEALAWYNSPLYQEAKQHRLKGANYSVFMVDGIEPDTGA